MTVPPKLADEVRAWITRDPDPETRAELEELLDADAADELAERFDGRLAFGTAGLRAPLGAGPRRMNRVVVRETAAGLCHYLGRHSRASPTVVIGFDARHKSDAFARDTAEIVSAAGGRALLLPRPLPTPVVAFLVTHLGADAGVVVTASHNPPADNGYKVYMGDGAQIVPPIDAEIAAAIDAAAGTDIPLSPDGVEILGDDAVDAYIAATVEAAGAAIEPAGDLRLVYTAMHGVGRDLIQRAFAMAGYPPLHEVAEQAEPDADFPTVAFPNPEEPGALDLALAHAEAVGADAVLANDPDADRLGVAVPAAHGSGWQTLSGNEIGVLLADHVLTRTTGDDRLVATTVVSSRLLGRMAAAAGVEYAETLTGFKWIVRPALERVGRRFVFGYEEALGYLVAGAVLDKDGIGAALAFAGLLADAKRAGETVHDRLERLARAHGLHRTDQVVVRVQGADAADRLAALMRRLRGDQPAELAGRPVEGFRDLLVDDALSPTDALIYELEGGARLVVRPSGTEPKLKAYLEVVQQVPAGPNGYVDANDQADRTMAQLRSATEALLA